MINPIGSEFDLHVRDFLKKDENQLSLYFPQDNQKVFLSMGRGAIKVIIDLLNLSKSGEILLPAYLCAETLIPFKADHVKCVFYSLKKDLKVDLDDIQEKITENTKAIFLIHYFGFPQPVDEIKKVCEGKNICLIEDCAQAAFTLLQGKPLGSSSDFSFSSYRKFLPIPDGAMLFMKNGNGKVVTKYSLRHFGYSYLRALFMLLKSLQLKHLLPKYFFKESFNIPEKLLADDTRPSGISFLSRKLLEKFDFNTMIKKRQTNFKYLMEHLDTKRIQPLYRDLPEGVCPLGFPIITPRRDAVKNALIKNRIYSPVHWELPEEIDKKAFASSWGISESILTIPIDQRYGKEDMNRIVTILNENV